MKCILSIFLIAYLKKAGATFEIKKLQNMLSKNFNDVSFLYDDLKIKERLYPLIAEKNSKILTKELDIHKIQLNCLGVIMEFDLYYKNLEKTILDFNIQLPEGGKEVFVSVKAHIDAFLQNIKHDDNSIKEEGLKIVSEIRNCFKIVANEIHEQMHSIVKSIVELNQIIEIVQKNYLPNGILKNIFENIDHKIKLDTSNKNDKKVRLEVLRYIFEKEIENLEKLKISETSSTTSKLECMHQNYKDALKYMEKIKQELFDNTSYLEILNLFYRKNEKIYRDCLKETQIVNQYNKYLESARGCLERCRIFQKEVVKRIIDINKIVG
ncbi:hypothetical protein EDEG_00461 [Edhazardia aedis USNM 41457]|uniref:Uncharacterized protein n=1 Tax=Edhazardia aedis (strain USNM 41457) TaxID=1003232 RepID=J8ZNV4_EDHAE|nr:hypothetical protein EDEG_00461 [Edhazardia aedis USNM 41457]|eukprot:EJW01373.1 hypothetical protein EDEG_00461 [Edhazardia aedis USNM 41457]